jgi:hypothetical protein
MIVTQYEAAKMLGVTKQYLFKLSKQVPRPLYFLDLKEGAARVDTENPDFKYLAQRIKRKQERTKTASDKMSIDKLMTVMDHVITEMYGKEDSIKIKMAIIERM